MDKSYEPQSFERKWYERWEADGCFKPTGRGEPYCIMLPPPNVTGTLHMGHAFQHTIMDTLIRYQRMRGRDTLWQMGTDHAGIATEMVVTRQLAAEGLTRDGLGRQAFIDRVWQWKKQSGDTITRQMRRMGTSGDWSRERFTYDEGLSQAVIETFVRLYKKGLIYREQELVNWDPELKTAISDLEVVSEEEDGKLWSIRYPLAGGVVNGVDSLVVATTRPETMLGDAAVAVHPEDERYKHLVGKMVRLPLCDREIPIIADEYVDKDFGTGCVKITPAHDRNDKAVWTRHKDSGVFTGVPKNGLINIFTESAQLKSSGSDDFQWGHRAPSRPGEAVLADGDGLVGNLIYSLIPEKYRGKDRFDARKLIIQDLSAHGLFVEEKKHRLQVPRGDRSNQIIEPFLTYQWFVKMDALAARGLELVENGSVRFVPENWINTYRHWLGNIQDWCISRQLWWGHQIPAWYDERGNIYVGRNEAEVRAKNSLASGSALTQDEDVLETWFSSALWSHSTLGWPDPQRMHSEGFDRYLPTSVLVTGFDIIFFWVARMIMMTDHFTGRVPFREVYITGLVRDKDGQKMSKSKGNILDPLDILDGITLDALVAKRTGDLMQPQMAEKIEKATRKEFPNGIAAFGADALRFTFASLATHGRDIKFDLQRCEGYRNFCNKLWNASRFVLMMVEEHAADLVGGDKTFGAAERWIASRLARTVTAVNSHFQEYRFDLASQAIYEFAWNDFCDWYLELSKVTLNDANAAADLQRGVRYQLVQVLETLLRLTHPIMPFITEEIWQRVAPLIDRGAPTIMHQAFPAATAEMDEAVEKELGWLQTLILGVRRVRAEMNIAPGKPLPLIVQGGSAHEQQWLQAHRAAIQSLARLSAIDPLAGAAPDAATALAGDMTLLIPIADLIDPRAELARLDKELARLSQEQQRVSAKLANENYVSRAPADVIAKERAKLDEAVQALSRLSVQREKIATMTR